MIDIRRGVSNFNEKITQWCKYMKLLYPLTTQLDHTELMYSLRSVEAHLKDVDEIIVVSDNLPYWLTNITQLSLGDVVGRKQLSIRRKILAGLNYTNEFLFMNDDDFFVKDTVDFPYYWHGLLKPYAESGARPLEKQLMVLGKPTKLFDGHYPLIYDQKFKQASEHFSADCIIKSMYCNFFNIEGEFCQDCKLTSPLKKKEIYDFIQDKNCFSTGLQSIQSAVVVLQELFPNKSKYEISSSSGGLQPISQHRPMDPVLESE